MARRTLHLPWAAVGALFVAALLLTGCSGAALTPSSWPGLAADAETAYVASNQAVYAVDLATGAERWRFPSEPNRAIALYAPPLITDDGLIILGGFDKVVHAIHASDGSPAWTFAQAKDRFVGGASQAGDLILVPSSDHTLYALQRASGALVWSFETGAPLWAAPLVDGEAVYLPSQDHTLYALDLRTGKPLWSSDLSGARRSQGGPGARVRAHAPRAGLPVHRRGVVALRAGVHTDVFRARQRGHLGGHCQSVGHGLRRRLVRHALPCRLEV